MEAIPIPPPIPIAPTLNIPEPVLAEPQWIPPEWAPVPIYEEDIPEDPEVGPSEEKKEEKEEAKPPPKPAEAPKPPPIPELSEVQTITLPIIGTEIPVPRAEILVTATTTAGVSSVVAVSGTLFATTMFRQLQPILKPVFKFALKKLAAIRKKPPPLSFGRERLQARRLRTRGKRVKKDGS